MNKDRYKKIMDRISGDYNMLVDRGFEVVGVFLQGSDNYKLDYEGSDINTKAILLPSFEDFLLNKKLISTTIELEPSKEHIDIKDIRLMFDNFKKQNINFIEILFTEYKYVNPKYEKIFQKMFDIREDIARYNIHKTLNSIAGMSMEKFKAMEHPYPSLIHKIEKFGYDPKQVYHIFRLSEFIKKYIQGESYADCLVSNYYKFLIDIKKGEIFNLEGARNQSKQTCDNTYTVAKDYMSKHPNIINTKVDDVMTQVLVDIFRLRFKEELK